jgi:antitoxin component YwqK of YwqJK toxin-antitoxin module
MSKSNKVKNLLIVCLVMCFVFNLTAQDLKDPLTGMINRVYVQYGDSLAEAYYYRGDKTIKPKDDNIYYWYGVQDFKHTRGGFDGKILHGEFVMFYRNKDLLSKGNFKYGLKQGEWKTWYIGGERKSKEKWHNGKLIGSAYYYGLNGKLNVLKKVNRNGNGSIVYYDKEGKLSSKEYYNKNVLVKNNDYQLNKKGKSIEIKLKKEKNKTKDKSERKQLFNFKKLFHKKNQSDQPLNGVKKQKEKKTKSPKVKIIKFRQISPGGIGT